MKEEARVADRELNLPSRSGALCHLKMNITCDALAFRLLHTWACPSASAASPFTTTRTAASNA